MPITTSVQTFNNLTTSNLTKNSQYYQKSFDKTIFQQQKNQKQNDHLDNNLKFIQTPKIFQLQQPQQQIQYDWLQNLNNTTFGSQYLFATKSVFFK